MTDGTGDAPESATDESASEGDQAARREGVRDRYGSIAESAEAESSPDDSASSCCGGSTDCCSGGDADQMLADEIEARGYDPAAVDRIDTEVGSLGCGNPTAIANLDPGETVLDLGSGGGFDCFLALEAVGTDGRVIGVDMTPGMLEKARDAKDRNDAGNVEFRLGEMEHLPVADERVDAVISNCAINLSTDKGQVFSEIDRVLQPGGRLAVSDVVRTGPLPDDARLDPDAFAGCIAGAVPVNALRRLLVDAGFVDIRVTIEAGSESFISDWAKAYDPSEFLASARIEARKPAPDQ
ncbi:MAG: arsenite methyltransferase [Natrialbaceae archaeon]|jgi:arsenite methyltransferase